MHSSVKLPKKKTLGTLYKATPFSQRRLLSQHQQPTGHFKYFLLPFFSYTKKGGVGEREKEIRLRKYKKRKRLPQKEG